MSLRNYVVIAALLVVAPLAAQGNTVITVNDTTVVTIYDNDSTFIFIEQAPRDSAAVARDEAAARAMDGFAEFIATCGCMGGGSSRTTQIATGGIAFFLGLIWWELRKDKGGTPGADGAPGKDGSDGADGQDGKDAEDHSHDDDDHYGESE